MIPGEFDTLRARAVAGVLTEREARRLLEACRADPALAQALRRDIQLERLLMYQGSQRGDATAFAREIMARLDAVPATSAGFVNGVMSELPDRERVAPFPIMRILYATAACIACLLATWLAGLASRPLARLTGGEAMRWKQEPVNWSKGDRLHLAAGFARIQFERGAEVILEGPAEMEFTGGNSAILHRGSAAVEVPPRASGFTLVGPDARVVDVGTRFAMSVIPQQPTEVHVLEGLVLASTSKRAAARELRTDQAIEVIDGEPRPIPAKPNRFLTALPPHQSRSIGYLHWSFDETEGIVSRNDGPGIGGNRADALFRRAAAGGKLPERVAGVFGKGIFLDGSSAYLETNFPGIGGTQSRTVAMWVRVPSDWTVNHGYALASWGSLSEYGKAWQLSINPGDLGGEVGHLRVGTHGNYAVGVTDLRDGKWHHIAAVMYEDAHPRVATHVLLYVDGRLEPAEIKSTRSIDTDITGPKAVKLQIGRNLGTAPTQQKRFFRGWIDELFVANEALTARQIEGLMMENRLVPASRSDGFAYSDR